VASGCVVVLFGCAVVICVPSCVCVSLGLCTAAAVSAGLCAAVYVCVSANLATICVGAVCDFWLFAIVNLWC